MTEKSAHGVKTEEDKNADKISLGTLGMDAKSAMEPEASDEEKMYDENGSEIKLNIEGQLPEKVLESLLNTQP